MTGLGTRSSERPPAGPKSVLLVDDDPAMAAAVRRILEAADYCVVVANRGEAAVDAVTGHAFSSRTTRTTKP
jgi:CheY-like chemotaxis protein